MLVDNVHPIGPAAKAWRCVLIGTESLLTECGTLLEQRGHEIVAVVSDRAEIIAWATARSVPALPEASALLAADLGPVDYLFSITNLKIMSADVLALPSVAAINFHDGPLPEHAGLNSPTWALLHGATTHGISWHLMTSDIDGGAVLDEQRFAIAADETALTLNQKCFVAGIEAFETLIDGMAASGGPTPLRPPATPLRISRGSDRPPACGAIRWDGPAEQIDRLVRALDFGRYANPVGTAQACFQGQRLIVGALSMAERGTDLSPGTIIAISPTAIVVATATRDVEVTRITTMRGEALSLADAVVRFSLSAGGRFDLVAFAQAERLSACNKTVAVHERFWLKRLAEQQAVDLPGIDRQASGDGVIDHLDLLLPASDEPARSGTIVAAVTAYLARIADNGRFDVGFSSLVMTARLEGTANCFTPQLPLRVDCGFAADFTRHRAAVVADIGELHRRIGISADLAARTPNLRRGAANPLVLPVAVVIVADLDAARAEADTDLTIVIRSDGRSCRWIFQPGRLPPAAVAAMQQQFAILLSAIDRGGDIALADLPLLDGDALTDLMVTRNATAGAWRQDACIHQLIAEQAQRTPDRIALTCEDRSLTYGDLDRRANRWARRLRALGVGPETLVGIYVARSIDMVVGLLAVHKAGGAYVPLDPDYPADRIRHMIEDSGVDVILTQSQLRDQLPATDIEAICLDVGWAGLADVSDAPLDGGAGPDNLAYVIYTSGSTGRPKGVMIEHRNVVNFFAGMDERIVNDQAERPRVWLAVTSLSFDISVLELLWTLTRGFHVVIYTGEDRRVAGVPEPHADRALDFSLFYFASDAAATTRDKYRLLLEGAKFADRSGFAAIWTPERHFHAFGGLYPNPAITSAAIAAITDTIEIRAGSVVLPLHHPVRVAEEWSVVDNLSNGRVAISFAAGWQPDDFILAPENFADKKDIMLRDIDIVRRLWRGEAVDFANPLGEIKPITILPRPVQPELPFWLTSAGNIETFAAAGRMGANILTHLLGQTIEEVTTKLAAYRDAWRLAGHAGDGRAALMLHSFVGDDAEAVRATVRGPLTDYLRSSTSLIKQYAWSFPAFKRPPGMEDANHGVELDSLDDEEMTALLDHAFERYYATSGLFGTAATCAPMIARLKAAGIDEVACLIDFGIDTATVLAHLPQLDAVRRMAVPRATAASYDMPTLIERHGVTHLQCTPSLASLLLADERAPAALSGIEMMMIGGEAFPPALARDLQRLVGGAVMNMYGPTETTIWSTVERLGDFAGSVPLGTPLRNQQVYILDRRQRPLPDGIPGELVIGGEGLARGYMHLPDLTADRFVAHPLGNGSRVYRTGDLARFRADGSIEFLGRLDNQVKIRGHRIELGEIEAELMRFPLVREAVVVARDDVFGNVTLVAYVTASPSAPAGLMSDDLRAHMRMRLPDIMCPTQFVTLAALPRTPNGKIDRNALPAAGAVEDLLSDMPFLAPADGVEARIAAIWRDLLKLPSVGVNDNFFDIGGHSLLAVQLHRALRLSFGQSLTITDIFRFTTIAALGARLGGVEPAVVSELGKARGHDRRAALGRRRSASIASNEVG